MAKPVSALSPETRRETRPRRLAVSPLRSGAASEDWIVVTVSVGEGGGLTGSTFLISGELAHICNRFVRRALLPVESLKVAYYRDLT
jgi:hypothetical protein